MYIDMDPIENSFSIKGLSIKDIDLLINNLQELKSQAENNLELLNETMKNHVPDEAELSGAVGYHPKEGFRRASSTTRCSTSNLVLKQYENIYKIKAKAL